ncbi:homoserine kinase [Candidatus Phycosocius spiralis]|uniref:Homoserine kinase n=1 Tax=Candidatus Phycosocius spiralis TaxID=2815099 RepID=A0ABQ4PV01_9PROT|nr:homoserine kinase [Candidatus Phycosocius spiralis]GIU66847.1 homoserine kinase [Candidatus Phycosocius spiralis]
MAVYTEPTDEELATLLNAWGLDGLRNFKGIAEGIQNSNFLIEVRQGRFILTIYEKSVVLDDLPFYLGLTETAANAGLPAARPIRTQDGEMVQMIRGKPTSLCTFLDGVSSQHPPSSQTRAAGAALAQLHLALADYPQKRPNDLGPHNWSELWAGRAAHSEDLEPGIAPSIDQDLKEFAANWPRDLPRGIIHADLFPDNVLFLGDRVNGLIDFYFACEDFLAYDLAVMLNAWCFEANGREFDLVKGRALIMGYETVRPLSQSERNALPLLARGAALRFFLTRLVDWVTPMDGALVRKKDPRDYAARLAFHRNARSAADYGAPE